VKEQAGTWLIFAHHYPRISGGCFANIVSDLLCADGWFDTGLAQLEMVFVQKGGRTRMPCFNGFIEPWSDAQLAEWEGYVLTAPKHRFERARRRIAMTLRGDPALDDLEDLNLFDTLTREQVGIAAGMVLQGLRIAEGRLKPKDGVDLSRVIAATEKLRLRRWDSDEALRAEHRIAFAADRQRIENMNPWSKIELSGCHPKARKMLDQPSDWDPANDFAPHGNDLGADILGGWDELAGRSVEDVMARFEVNASGTTPGDALDRVQVILAMCFAQVKRKGQCEAGLATRALTMIAVDRETVVGSVVDDHRAGFVLAMDRYTAMLRRFAEAASKR
jgi:uncharacterized protein YfeS